MYSKRAEVFTQFIGWSGQERSILKVWFKQKVPTIYLGRMFLWMSARFSLNVWILCWMLTLMVTVRHMYIISPKWHLEQMYGDLLNNHNRHDFIFCEWKFALHLCFTRCQHVALARVLCSCNSQEQTSANRISYYLPQTCSSTWHIYKTWAPRLVVECTTSQAFSDMSYDHAVVYRHTSRKQNCELTSQILNWQEDDIANPTELQYTISSLIEPNVLVCTLKSSTFLTQVFQNATPQGHACKSRLITILYCSSGSDITLPLDTLCQNWCYQQHLTSHSQGCHPTRFSLLPKFEPGVQHFLLTTFPIKLEICAGLSKFWLRSSAVVLPKTRHDLAQR